MYKGILSKHTYYEKLKTSSNGVSKYKDPIHKSSNGVSQDKDPKHNNLANLL